MGSPVIFFFQGREAGEFFLHKIARIGSSCVNVQCAVVCFEAHFVYELYFIHSFCLLDKCPLPFEGFYIECGKTVT